MEYDFVFKKQHGLTFVRYLFTTRRVRSYGYYVYVNGVYIGRCFRRADGTMWIYSPSMCGESVIGRTRVEAVRAGYNFSDDQAQACR